MPAVSNLELLIPEPSNDFIAGATRQVQPDHIRRGIVIRLHQAFRGFYAKPLDEAFDEPPRMRPLQREVKILITLAHGKRNRLARRPAHYRVDKARCDSRLGILLGQRHSGIDDGTSRHPIEKAELKKSEAHNR